MLEQLADNIVKDSYNYVCNYIFQYFNNAIINYNDTVINTHAVHSVSPNWFDYYCSKGYDTFYNIIDSKAMTEFEVVVITQAIPGQTTNWFYYYYYKGYGYFRNIIVSNSVSANQAIIKTGLYTSIYHMSHIVNFFYTIPAGEYNIDN